LRVAAVLVPKELNVALEQKAPANLPPADWALVLDLVRLIRENAPPGANALPGEIVPALEEAIRSHFAKPVE
jgi:hypothetical protein